MPKLKERVEKLLDENKQLLQELKNLKKDQLDSLVNSLRSQVESVSGMPFLAVQLSLEAEALRLCADELSRKLSSGVLVLAAEVAEGRCQLIVRVSDDLTHKVNALDLIKTIAPIVGGSGGGRANSAQAGGKDSKKIPEALAQAKKLLQDVR